LALIAAPLWSLIADHRQSIITDDTTTATTVDTNPRRTKPNPDEMHFTSGNFGILFGDQINSGGEIVPL
jgi:hypothetical protein